MKLLKRGKIRSVKRINKATPAPTGIWYHKENTTMKTRQELLEEIEEFVSSSEDQAEAIQVVRDIVAEIKARR